MEKGGGAGGGFSLLARDRGNSRQSGGGGAQYLLDMDIKSMSRELFRRQVPIAVLFENGRLQDAQPPAAQHHLDKHQLGRLLMAWSMNACNGHQSHRTEWPVGR